MGFFRSIYRYFVSLGGLIEIDNDIESDNISYVSKDIESTFKKTRDKWTEQYSELRESVAQLLIVLDKKITKMDSQKKDLVAVEIEMKNIIEESKKFPENAECTPEFKNLFNHKKELKASLEIIDTEISDLSEKVSVYKNKLKEMQNQIDSLDEREATAIADIVSSQQIINLNDRLNNMSTELDEKQLSSIERKREHIVSEAKISTQLREIETESQFLSANLELNAEAAFNSMVENDKKQINDKVNE
jgi:uncharacterized protein (DUF3084 family)